MSMKKLTEKDCKALWDSLRGFMIEEGCYCRDIFNVVSEDADAESADIGEHFPVSITLMKLGGKIRIESQTNDAGGAGYLHPRRGWIRESDLEELTEKEQKKWQI